MRFIPLLLLQFLAIPLFAQQASSGPHGGLRPFGSDAELLSYFRKMREEQERARLATDSAYRRYVAELAKCSSDSIPARLSSLPPTTQSADAVIGGRTIDSGNQPQSWVSVVVSQLGLKTTTGADGRYRIVIPTESLQTSRRVTVRALRIGFNAAVRTVTVGRRDSVELDLRLCGGAALALEQVVVAGAAAAMTVDGVALQGSEQITNTQHAGVDEGGIVKVHGDHLVILRRGRLFTVAIGGSDLAPTAAVNAFGPDVDPTDTWYDELLVSGNKVVVIGYSYDRGGTEVGVFTIDARGRLDYVATYELRSNDYYSDRNYASRLIGTKLIFYAPLYVWNDFDNPLAALPAVRRWYRDGHDTTFKRIAPAPRIYRSPGQLKGDDIALHTVTICDLAQTSLGCQATVIVGPSGRVFYVSPRAVYVWTSAWTRSGRDDQDGMLYRMPLDGSTPSALGVAGSPVDQFSFLESDGRLTVLVRSEAYGDAMWLPEWAGGDVALLRVPITAFGDGDDRAPWWQYRRLPTPTDGDHDAFHNRFVGEYLLYGLGSGWGRPRGDSATVFAVRWTGAGNGAVSALRLAHGVDRIEQMGGDAVVVGADSDDLHFTGIRLTGAPVLAQRYTMSGASQGETRSHGFFYRVDGADTGVLGLPVSQAGRPGYRQLIDGSAGVLFLRNQGQRFRPLGVLRTRAKETDDQCLASCVDWYGNARPLFLRGRVFALLGYEVVEGTITGDSIQEVRRISFAPGKQTVAR